MSLDISELMDGELDEQTSRRAFAALREDAQAREAWETYHLIGDALRGAPAMDGARRVHGLRAQQRVLAALADEPTVLAPPARRAVPTRWLRYSMAAAAAVAAFGIVTLLPPLQQGQAPKQIATNTPNSRAAEPVQPVALDVNDYFQAHHEVSPALRPAVFRRDE